MKYDNYNGQINFIYFSGSPLNNVCPIKSGEVCGNDGLTYHNKCLLENEIAQHPEKHLKEVPCGGRGNKPLFYVYLF